MEAGRATVDARHEPRAATTIDIDIKAEAQTRPRSAAADGSLAVLRNPSFAWFLTGTTLSNAAQWIQQVTLSWLVYDLTSSGALLGTLNLVRSIATVGLAPFAGVAIDRLPRRKLLFATSMWLFAISLGFGLALLGSPAAIWSLFVFGFLGGIGQALSIPLRQTVVISIVPLSLAPAAIALVQTGWAVMRSIGPAIGGFLILWFGPAGNFLLQATAYALVTLTILKLNLPEAKPGAAVGKAGGHFREGWDYIVSSRTTRTFLLLNWVTPLFIIPIFSALPPIYAKDIFSGGPDTLGALLSAIGTGGIVGGFAAASLGRLERRGILQAASLLALCLSLVAFALSTQILMALASLALAGFCEMIFLTANQTALQMSVPEALRGRVTGIISLRSGLIPVGAFIAGVGADVMGPRTITVLLAGTAGLVTVIAFLASPTIREYRLSQALESPSP